MKIIDVNSYEYLIKKAVILFWKTRQKQYTNTTNSGSRGAVTGGKQLDGFIDLLRQVAIETGVPEQCIYTKGNHLPGFYRATKAWDFLIISPGNKLIAAIELKSQVGSFGNNFNNRTEEALGSAIDIEKAIRENLFPNQARPWLGYLMVLEKSSRSTSPVKIAKTHFATLPEFNQTSYLQRYEILCKKLMLENHYNATCLFWTSSARISGSSSHSELSINEFILAFSGYLIGKQNDFA